MSSRPTAVVLTAWLATVSLAAATNETSPQGPLPVWRANARTITTQLSAGLRLAAASSQESKRAGKPVLRHPTPPPPELQVDRLNAFSYLHYDIDSAWLMGGRGIAFGGEYTNLTLRGNDLNSNIQHILVGINDRLQVGYSRHKSTAISSSGATRADGWAWKKYVAWQLDADDEHERAESIKLSVESDRAVIVTTNGGGVTRVLPAPARVWILSWNRTDRKDEDTIRHLNLLYGMSEIPAGGFREHTIGGKLGVDVHFHNRWELIATLGLFDDLIDSGRWSGTVSGGLRYEAAPGLHLQLAAFMAPDGLPFSGSFLTEFSSLNANPFMQTGTVRKFRDNAVGSAFLSVAYARTF